MAENKAKFVKRYERLIKGKNVSDGEFNEADRKLSEDVHENEEGMSIEEEDAGEEAYPELEESMSHEDNPEKEDGE